MGRTGLGCSFRGFGKSRVGVTHHLLYYTRAQMPTLIIFFFRNETFFFTKSRPHEVTLAASPPGSSALKPRKPKKKDDAHVKPVRSITEKMRRHRGASSIIPVERDHLRRRHFNVVSKFLFHNGFFSLYLIIFSDVLAVEAPSPVHSPEAPEPEAPPPSMCTMACFPCARYCLCCAAVTMACSAAVAATLLAAFLLRMFLFSR